MDEKFKNGLANQVMDEFDNVKDLRASFIQSNSDTKHLDKLRDMMQTLLDMYFELTNPEE